MIITNLLVNLCRLPLPGPGLTGPEDLVDRARLAQFEAGCIPLLQGKYKKKRPSREKEEEEEEKEKEGKGGVSPGGCLVHVSREGDIDRAWTYRTGKTCFTAPQESRVRQDEMR